MEKFFKTSKLFIYTLGLFLLIHTIPAVGAVTGPGASWLYVRSLGVSPVTPSANFQVKVTLTSALGTPSYTNINADGSDLRFYDNNNNLCNYWIEAWNDGGTSIIWVKVPVSGSSVLYMFYGNTGASATSSGATTFDFFDDFLGASLAGNWSTNASGGSIGVTSGQVTLSNTSGGTVSISSAFTPASTSFFIETKHREGGYYRNRFYAATGVGAGSPTGFDYGYYVNGGAQIYWNGIWSGTGMAINTNYLTRWQLTDGSTYNWSTYNYATMAALEATRTTTVAANIRAISFLVTEAAGTSTIIDWVRVRKQTASEPVVTIGSTQYNNNLVATITSQTNVVCYGQFTGSATVAGTGGTTPYTYLWSNGQTTATATGLAAGNYTVTINESGVGLAASTSVTITQPAAPTASNNGPLCEGATLNLSASAAVSYSWSGPAGFSSTSQTPSISNTTVGEAGVYSVTVTDANGCTPVATTTATIHPLPTITPSATAAGVCVSAGAQNSSLSYSATTNSPNNYTITWDAAALTAGLQNAGTTTLPASPVTVPIAAGVTHGTYNGTITVTNANGCASTGNAFTVAISESPVITSAATGSVCSGVAQNYTITGTLAPTYTWSRAAVAGISNSAVSGQTSNTITESLVNTTTAPVNVTYLITPASGGCNGSTFSYVVTVNPSFTWFNQNWLYRKVITIDHTKVPNTNQTDFPVLVSLTSDAGLIANAQASGNDILFTTADGTTQIPYQRESYSTGTLVAWVNVPVLSHSQNTILYMYYGNAAASDQQQAANVWDANYAGVYHLNEPGAGTAGEYKDSKAGTVNGTVADQVIRAVYSMTAAANAYCYQRLTAPTNHTIVAGDVLEYDVYWTSSNDLIAVDLICTDGTALRAVASADQNGRSAHPSTDISAYALNKWYHRVIPIPAAMNGKTINVYDIACEHDNTGTKTAYFSNIYIRNGTGITKTIYVPGGSVANTVHINTAGSALSSMTNVQDPVTRSVAGKTGAALNTDAVRFLNMPSRATSVVSDFTLEAWVQLNEVSQHGYFLYNGNDGAGYGFGIGNGTGGAGSKLIGIYGAVAWIPSAYTFSGTGSWQHVVMQRSAGGTTSFFVNGVPYAATSGGSATPNTPNNFFTIGNQLNSAGLVFRYFNGPIDEVRISTVARSADWIATEYNNQNSPATFYTVSTEQVNPAPVQTASICTGGTFTITPANAPTGTTYTWGAPVINPPGSITGSAAEGTGQTDISQTLTNITTAVATATYTVTPWLGGCPGASPFTVTVTVNPLPLATATNNSQTICSAAAFTTMALGTSNSIAGTTFTWTRDNGTLSTGDVTGIAASGTGTSIAGAVLTNTTSSAVTVTFTITPTGPSPALCAGSPITATVTVNPGPGDNAGADQTICNGTGTGIGASPVGGRTYSWSPGTALSNTAIANPVASPVTTTTYTLTETITATGCSAANTVVIAVNSAIGNNTVSAAQTICENTSPAALTGTTPNGGSGSYTYLWESSTTSAVAGFSTASGTSNGQNYTPPVLTQNTWYRRVVISAPCANHTSAAILITVNALPVITSLSASPASPICASSTTTLTANGVAGFNTTTTWYTGPGGTGINLGTGSTKVVGAGQTYYAYVTNVCGNAQQSLAVATETTAPGAFTVNDISLNNSPNNGGKVAGVFTLPAITDNCAGEGKATTNSLPLPANLKLWVKADAGVVVDASGNVAEWRDLSGNANNFTQAAFSSRPVKTASSPSFNNLPCITFSTTAKYMTNVTNLDAGAASTYTIFTVSRENGGTNQRLISSASTNWLMGYWSGAKNQLFCNGWISASGTPAADAVVHMYGVSSNSTTASGTTLYDYGRVLATGTAGTPNGPGKMQLNGWNNGLNEVSTGEVAEIIYYNVVLSAAQRQIVEGYLAYKYNLQAPLASVQAYQTYVSASASTVNFLATDQSGNTATTSATVNPATYPGPVVNATPATVCSNNPVSVTLSNMAPSGNYLNCATANDYMMVGTSTSTSNVAIGNNWTIETWFKYPLPANGGWNTFTRGTNFHHIIVSQNATATPAGGGAVGNLGVYNGGFFPCGYNFLTSGSTPSNGWHHLTAVGTGGTTSFYIDGVFVGKSLSQPTDNIVALGNYQFGGQYAGQMDEVRIWNTALSQNTISNYMTQRITASHPDWDNLVAYYRMDGNGTNSSTSSSACVSCNGTLQSAASVSAASAYYTYTATNTLGGTLSPASPSTAETYTINNPTTTGAVSFTATANTITSAGGSSATVTVNPAPGNNTGGNQGICTGSAGTTIGAASTAGHTYSWSPAGTLSNSTVSNPFASPVVTTTYTLTETVTATGCTASNTAVVSVNPVIAGNTVTAAQSVCSGKAPTPFTGSTPTGGNGTYTYLWETSTTSAVAGFSAASGTNNGKNYTSGAITENTWYRRIVISGGCSSTSAAILVTVNPLPEITINTNYCGINGAVQLSSNTFTSYLWNTGATTQSITVDLAGIYSVTATNSYGCTAVNAATVALELVTNGKFDSGNTGFTTDYTNNQTQPAGLMPEGLYAIGTNANNHHPLFYGKDHTTGTGNFMIVNGHPSATPTIVWSQTVNILPNTDYYFSAFAMSLNQVAPYSQLQFRVNGVQVGTIAALTPGANNAAGPFSWTRFYGTWNSFSDTVAVISIVDLQTSLSGNDFALDDISCSTLSPLAFSVSPTGIGPAVCEGDAIALVSNATGSYVPFTYSWAGPNSYTSTAANPSIPASTLAMAGTYSVTVTNVYGCTATGSTNIVVGAYPLDKTVSAAAGAVCSNAPTNIQVASSESGISYQLRNNADNTHIGSPVIGTGGTINLPTGNLTGTTTLNVLATNLSTYCSTQLSNTPTVTVATTPVLVITNQAACTGTINLTAPAVTAGSTGGGTLSYWTNAGTTTPVATPAAVTSGTYYIKSTLGACSDIEPVVAIISSTPVATFSYTGTPYCRNSANPLPTFSGGGVAGQFSSTAGLVFASTSTGQINLAASTPGTYTVTNTITPAGACSPVSSNSTVVITALPVATFSYTNNALCQSANANDPSPVFSGGGAAGTFSSSFGLTFISTATGQIDISACTPGNYAIVNTRAATGGCPVVQHTEFIDINPYSFTGSLGAIATPSTICQGDSTALSLNIPTYRSAVLKQNFNGSITGWSVTNSSTGGTPANASWTLRTNAYSYAGTTTVFNSNDNSQFYLSNSHAQGAGGTTLTILQSPAISTIGYSTLALDFFHYFRYAGGETAKVQVSLNGGTWADVATYTSNQGFSDIFTNTAINLDAYINQPTFYVRFKYEGASSKFFWAIDNISITGYSNTYSYAWSSSPGGFSSVAAGPKAAPLANTSYTATATNTYGCSSDATPVAVTVNPIPADSAGVDMDVCFGSAVGIGTVSVPGRTYSWSPAANLSNTSVSNPSASPAATTTYTLTETITATGCTASNSMVVNVIPPPEDKTIVPEATVVCPGGSTTIQVLNSVAGVDYQLRNNAGNSLIGLPVAGTGGTIGLPTGSLAVNTTFNVLATTVATTCQAQMGTTGTVSIATPGMWVGLYSSDWNNAANWCAAIPTYTTDVVIPQGTPYSPVISTPAYCHHLDIQAGNSLTITTHGHLLLYGNLLAGGNYNHTAGVLEFKGDATQTIPAITADSVIVDNSSGQGQGIKLGGHLIVNRSLVLNNGIIETGSHTVVLQDTLATSLSGSSDSSYINGKLRRALADTGTYLFPVGDTLNYQLAVVHLTANSHRVNTGIDSLTAFFTRVNSAACTTVPGSAVWVSGTSLTELLNGGYWTLHPDTTVYSNVGYNITVHEKGYTNAPADPHRMSLIKRNECAAPWQSVGVHTNSTQTIANNTATATRTLLSTFSDFGVGFSGESALPVEMLYLEAYDVNNQYIRVAWATAIEINNAGFDVMRSTDGIHFSKIGWVQGYNNSTISRAYTLDDKEAEPRVRYYYKLRQVDNNGHSEETEMVTAIITTSNIFTVSDFYPNPAAGNSKLTIHTSLPQPVSIKLYDALGRIVLDNTYNLTKGRNDIDFDIQMLSDATYNASITAGDMRFSKNLVIQKSQ